ncbi:F-box/SPRY domain-containing protein 1-like [Hordeum vulgare]|nr:F-box/SPRY domain-containing protein 1-like [Hordeum vulgare]
MAGGGHGVAVRRGGLPRRPVGRAAARRTRPHPRGGRPRARRPPPLPRRHRRSRPTPPGLRRLDQSHAEKTRAPRFLLGANPRTGPSCSWDNGSAMALPPLNEGDLATPAALRAPADVISRVFSQPDCVDLLSCSLVCRATRRVEDGVHGAWNLQCLSVRITHRRAQLAPSEACEPGALDLQPGRAPELHCHKYIHC